MADDEAPDANILIANFLRSVGEERETWLTAIQRRLPSWIRVYDRDGLAVYYDAKAPLPSWPVDASTKTPLPPWLTLPANYVEAVAADGSAEVIKGGFGTRKLKKTTEPKIPTALERLLGEDDLV